LHFEKIAFQIKYFSASVFQNLYVLENFLNLKTFCACVIEIRIFALQKILQMPKYKVLIIEAIQRCQDRVRDRERNCKNLQSFENSC